MTVNILLLSEKGEQQVGEKEKVKDTSQLKYTLGCIILVESNLVSASPVY